LGILFEGNHVIRVLITGGAGYKGVILAEQLLKSGCKVTILDNFLYGYESVLGFASEKNCSIVKRDIRDLAESDLRQYDIVYHLAAISGYPACEANPHSAQMVNVVSTEKLVRMLSDDQLLVYASTTSLYGESGRELDESATPTPASLYGITKWKAETICMQRRNTVSFRFATLFGASRRMRCDLLLNDFVYRVLFDSHSVRTFLHVRDAIQAYCMVLDQAGVMAGQIYNVGANTMNYSKLELARIIQSFLHNEIIETQLSDPDRRDFIINFDKIAALGFRPSITVAEGIEELLRLYAWYQPHQSFRPL
jgi:nucleoside-diphosphate-sugar epimerase